MSGSLRLARLSFCCASLQAAFGLVRGGQTLRAAAAANGLSATTAIITTAQQDPMGGG